MTEHHSLEAFRRNQLIEATLDCVIENGLERRTLRSVAQRAGVTTGMVVNYFSSKAELMAAALDAAIEKVRAYLDDATGSTLGLKRIEAIATLLLSDDPADKLPGRFFIRFWLAALDHEDLKPRSL